MSLGAHGIDAPARARHGHLFEQAHVWSLRRRAAVSTPSCPWLVWIERDVRDARSALREWATTAHGARRTSVSLVERLRALVVASTSDRGLGKSATRRHPSLAEGAALLAEAGDVEAETRQHRHAMGSGTTAPLTTRGSADEILPTRSTVSLRERAGGARLRCTGEATGTLGEIRDGGREGMQNGVRVTLAGPQGTSRGDAHFRSSKRKVPAVRRRACARWPSTAIPPVRNVRRLGGQGRPPLQNRAFERPPEKPGREHAHLWRWGFEPVLAVSYSP